MDIQKEKKELIEMFGMHFERLYILPPLASRILGTLILDGYHTGITFEMLVEITQSSKSSVSTSLNLLQKMNKVTYYTVAGDRKKYFRPAPFSERLDNYQNILEFEKKLIDRMISYRENTISNEEESFDLENVKEYGKYVLEMEKLLSQAVRKFREIETANRNKQQ
jgi:DNA-binding transcriptional regulator GbsR (MarR family)